MNRRNLIILISIATIILGIGAYFYFRKPSVVPKTGGTFPGEGLGVGYANQGGTGGETNIIIPVSGESTLPARLYELHKNPVAGISFFETGVPLISTTKKTVAKITPPQQHTVSARYIERGLGKIFETSLDALREQIAAPNLAPLETLISNETHTRLTEAWWGNKGNSVAIRSLETSPEDIIKTHVLNLSTPLSIFTKSTSTESALPSTLLSSEEVFLPDNIPFMATAEDGTDNLFYLEKGESSSLGTISNFKNAGATRVFTSPFTEWLPQFPNQNLIVLSTKPSGNIPGYLFFLNPKTKTLTKILDGMNGLTTKTSPDGKFILYSTSNNSSFDLFVYDVAKKESLPLLIKTLPEKCVWSKKEVSVIYCAVPQTIPVTIYPDRWYQGLVSFSDSVWKIDTTNARAEMVFDPQKLGASPLDIINPVLPSDDSALLFMNKITSTPWIYLLNMEVRPPYLPVATTTAPFTKTPVTATTTEGGR